MPPEHAQNQDSRAIKGALGKEIASALESITLEKVTEKGFANALQNAPLIADGQSISALRDTVLKKGEDDLVIAAGLSLHRFDLEPSFDLPKA